MNKNGSFVRIVKDVVKGAVITGNDVDVVEAGCYNQPANLLTTEETVIEQFAVMIFEYLQNKIIFDNT